MQKDLFGAATITPIPTQFESKPDFLQRYRINLRLDQVIIGALLCLVAYVFVFSFGVESGKRYAMAEIKAERAMRERMARELGEKIFANQQAAIQDMTKEAAAPLATAGISTADSKESSGAKSAVEKVKDSTAASETVAEKEQNASPKGKFAIQTVTFTTKSGAEAYLKKIIAKGYEGTIVTQGKYRQVRVIGFETRAKATEVLGKLKTLGLAPKDAYIRAV